MIRQLLTFCSDFQIWGVQLREHGRFNCLQLKVKTIRQTL